VVSYDVLPSFVVVCAEPLLGGAYSGSGSKDQALAETIGRVCGAFTKRELRGPDPSSRRRDRPETRSGTIPAEVVAPTATHAIAQQPRRGG
jgi:hypothetical protein